jgi:hypothetical protein
MMWPNVPAAEADVVIQEEAWMEFLNELPPEQQVIRDVDFADGQWDLLLDP